MNWKSTLGAPLSADEEDRIAATWRDLCQLAWHVPVLPEPTEMLNHVTDLIMKSWEVRRAISDGWFYANKRAAPAQVSKKFKANAEIARALELLSPDDIKDVLNQLMGDKSG